MNLDLTNKMFHSLRRALISRNPSQILWKTKHQRNNRQTNRYVRAEILIATNIMRRNPMDPTKTDFVSVTHINPGGIVDSKMGAKIVNALCAKAPVKLLISLERAANCAPVSKQEDKAKQPA